MRKLLSALIILSTTLTCSIAQAGSGKAILSHWGAVSTGTKPSYIFLSNITDNNINVTITFYDKNGSKLSPSTFTNFSNSNTQLAANKSGYVSIQSSAFNWGYATIEWSNELDDNDTVALVAHGFRVASNASSLRSDFSVPINNGMPF